MCYMPCLRCPSICLQTSLLPRMVLRYAQVQARPLEPVSGPFPTRTQVLTLVLLE